MNSTAREHMSSTHSQLKGELKQKHRPEAISFPDLTCHRAIKWGRSGEKVMQVRCAERTEGKQCTSSFM